MVEYYKKIYDVFVKRDFYKVYYYMYEYLKFVCDKILKGMDEK